MKIYREIENSLENISFELNYILSALETRKPDKESKEERSLLLLQSRLRGLKNHLENILPVEVEEKIDQLEDLTDDDEKLVHEFLRHTEGFLEDAEFLKNVVEDLETKPHAIPIFDNQEDLIRALEDDYS